MHIWQQHGEGWVIPESQAPQPQDSQEWLVREDQSLTALEYQGC